MKRKGRLSQNCERKSGDKIKSGDEGGKELLVIPSYTEDSQSLSSQSSSVFIVCCMSIFRISWLLVTGAKRRNLARKV